MLNEDALKNLNFTDVDAQFLTTPLKVMTKEQKLKAVAIYERYLEELSRLNDEYRINNPRKEWFLEPEQVVQGPKRFY